MTATMTRNASKRVGTTSGAPWESWSGSNAGKRIQFIQTYCRIPRGIGAGKHVKLEDFQTQYIEATYAEGILSGCLGLPRGNGKSELLACIAVAELFLNPWSPDIGVAAVTLAQSGRPSGVYGLAKRMIGLEPELADRTLIFSNNADPRATTPFNDGIMAPIATRDADSLLGLSSSLLIADEFGAAHWTDDRWGNLVQSGGKRGGESRVLGISTPNSKHSAMYTLRSRVLKGIASPSVHWAEFSAPEGAALDDRAAWHIANPALGKFLDITALEADLTDRPEWAFRQMRLGQWLDADGSGWLGDDGPAAWDATTTQVTMSTTEPTFVGVDKSAYNDCSAVAILQRHGDRWQCQVRVFFPSPVIDHAEVREHIREVCRTHHVVAVGYDDRYFVEGAQELEAEGLPLVQVPQTAARLVPAYSALHSDIIGRRLDHDDDLTLRQHVLSAIPSVQPNGGFMLAKNKSRHKIDGCVALGIARSMTELESDHEITLESLQVY